MTRDYVSATAETIWLAKVQHFGAEVTGPLPPTSTTNDALFDEHDIAAVVAIAWMPDPRPSPPGDWSTPSAVASAACEDAQDVLGRMLTTTVGSTVAVLGAGVCGGIRAALTVMCPSAVALNTACEILARAGMRVMGTKNVPFDEREGEDRSVWADGHWMAWLDTAAPVVEAVA